MTLGLGGQQAWTKKKNWVNLERNCGVASVREYNRVIWCYQLGWLYKLATVKSVKADIFEYSTFIICYDEGPTLKSSAFKFFTVANLGF